MLEDITIHMAIHLIIQSIRSILTLTFLYQIIIQYLVIFVIKILSIIIRNVFLQIRNTKHPFLSRDPGRY